MNNQIQIVSIEGNIGSGKSTLLANLKNYFKDNAHIIFLKEPVDEWSKIKDENGVTMLEKFYADQYKYSFSFQMMAYISRLKLLRDTFNQVKESRDKLIQNARQERLINYDAQENQFESPKYIIVTERSLFTDKMVFAKMLYDSGKIEHINYEIYINWFNTFADEFPINKIVYVKANPETCHQRIAIRHRDGEDNIPLDYLKKCNDYHDNMLDKTSSECVCKDNLILDGNIDIYKNDNVTKEWINSIEKFIYN